MTGRVTQPMDYTLDVAGKPAWAWQHDLPVLWPWLFDAAALTEARRLHTTALDAGALFREHATRCGGLPPWNGLLNVMDRISADTFFRELDVPPDTLLRLDLAPLEARRPYRFEQAAEQWRFFRSACEHRDAATAAEAWRKATLNPLRLSGNPRTDAVALSKLAERHGYSRHDRARIVVHLLFGRPVSRAATALTHRWIERAEQLPAAAYREKIAWWRLLFWPWRRE